MEGIRPENTGEEEQDDLYVEGTENTVDAATDGAASEGQDSDDSAGEQAVDTTDGVRDAAVETAEQRAARSELGDRVWGNAYNKQNLSAMAYQAQLAHARLYARQAVDHAYDENA